MKLAKNPEIRYKLLDKGNSVLFSNLLSYENKLLSEISCECQILKVHGENLRCGLMKNDELAIYFFSNLKDLLKSSRRFKSICQSIMNGSNLLVGLSLQVKDKLNEDTRRLLHNLTSLNAHNIQEMYSLVSQEDLSKMKSGHIDFIKKEVSRNPKEAARLIFRIAKNNVSMKTEFSVFKKLFNGNPILDRRPHNIHKVLMNIFYSFFSDFTDKEVSVDVKEGQLKAFFDYESIHVALYHIIENSAKYTLSGSDMTVSSSMSACLRYVNVRFEMFSIAVNKDEVDALFEEGYSGEIPKKVNTAGDGIGMNRVKRLINLNAGRVVFIPFPETCEEYLGMPYQKNVIEISLPARK